MTKKDLCTYQGKQVKEKMTDCKKKFVRYKEGAEIYKAIIDENVVVTKFRNLAKEAQAIYKIDGMVLVNCEIFEKFLEGFHL